MVLHLGQLQFILSSERFIILPFGKSCELASRSRFFLVTSLFLVASLCLHFSAVAVVQGSEFVKPKSDCVVFFGWWVSLLSFLSITIYDWRLGVIFLCSRAVKLFMIWLAAISARRHLTFVGNKELILFDIYITWNSFFPNHWHS